MQFELLPHVSGEELKQLNPMLKGYINLMDSAIRLRNEIRTEYDMMVPVGKEEFEAVKRYTHTEYLFYLDGLARALDLVAENFIENVLDKVVHPAVLGYGLEKEEAGKAGVQ